MWEKIRGWVLQHKKTSISAVAILLVLSIILSMCYVFGLPESRMDDAQMQKPQQMQEDANQNDDSEVPDDSEKADDSKKPDDSEKNDDADDSDNQGKPDKDGGDSGLKAENLSNSNKDESKDESAEQVKKYYTVTFETNGGNEIDPRKVIEGTEIASLPTPNKSGSIFLGWYYDADCTKMVGAKDVVAKDLTLYAEYGQQAELEPVENVTFASATDVDGGSFAITVVTEDAAMTVEQVKAAITAKNLTDPKQTDIIAVSGSNGVFTITGRNPQETPEGVVAGNGFADGATYRITLNDARLNFKDQPATAREFNFTTAKEDVLNLTLNQDIVFLSVEDVYNIVNDGQAVDTLHIAIYQADAEGNLGPSDLTTGSFAYDGELNVGDVICIYDGLIPSQRTFETPAEQNGDVAYVEITKKNGNSYSYKNATPEQVIFEPDMLPIPVAADLDTSNTTVTVENKHLDYSADVYSNIELDSQTTVDVGDFIMFYTGKFGILEGNDAAVLQSYGKVTKVEAGAAGTTVITYAAVSWEEVQTSMDIYNSERMSGAEMLSDVDTSELEAQISQQAIDSGFAEEAAMYMASLALATDNFTELSENINLEDYKVTLTDGTPISPEQLQLMASNVKVEAKLDPGYPKVHIGFTPSHLGDIEGTSVDETGLSVELEISVTLTIKKKGSESGLEIQISGLFVQELGLDLGTSSKTIWKVWGIFPYIAEYRVTANVDMLNYTHVAIDAVMMTREVDDGEDADNKLDAGIDKVNEVIDFIKDQLERMDARFGEEDEEEAEETADELTKRYKEMVQNESDWVRIVEATIFEKEKQLPPSLPIIAVEIQMDFVVQVDASVSIGMDLEYRTGKRYTYTIDVFAGSVNNDVVTLQEEQLSFGFYSLGRLGLRVGIEMEFNVGLFTTKFASVGFAAGAGAYAKLWGYFYYELRYTESGGREQEYAGALALEVGAYLELNLQAQAIGGLFSTEYTVFEKEWPLWTVGRPDNVRNFKMKQEEMPEIVMEQYIRTRTIPDSIFEMEYLDLHDGEEKSKIYNDYFDVKKKESWENRKNFDIRFDNDKFTYDPQTNTIRVTPAEGDKALLGEMTITWINYPLVFSSKPIQRTISLYWTNVRSGFVIVPYTNGGSYVDILNLKYDEEVVPPADPVRTGYIFDGWYADEEFTEPFVFPERMPEKDFEMFAKWTAATDTPYRVEHYQEQLISGEYELVETEEFTGTTETYVTPETKSYTGFISPAKQEIQILADGSAVLRYYYDLEWSSVTFEPGIIGGDAVTYDLKFGGRVTAPVMAARGYIFAGWDKAVAATMGTEDVVYTAQWEREADTPYRVEYYVQQPDGRFAMQHTLTGADFSDAVFTVDQLRNAVVDGQQTADQIYTAQAGITFGNMTVNGIACSKTGLSADGKTVIKINYKRDQFPLTLDYAYGGKVVTYDLYLDQEIVLPNTLDRPGYTLAGWTQNGEMVTTGVMTAEGASFKAVWAPNTYKVNFVGGHEDASGTMESQTFTYEQAQALSLNTFTRPNYVFAGWAIEDTTTCAYTDGEQAKNLIQVPNGEITLRALWNPATYTITYENDGDFNENVTSYNIESETIELLPAKRTGYEFAGWVDAQGNPVTHIEKGTVGDLAFTATWTPLSGTTYTVTHHVENIYKGYYTEKEKESFTGTTGETVLPLTKSYMGFKSPERAELVITADGKANLDYYYDRNTYTITLDADGGDVYPNTITARYGEEVTLPTPTKSGYSFEGWFSGDGNAYTLGTMPVDGAELIAHWIAGGVTYKVSHYQMNTTGERYELVETEYFTANIGDTVKPEVKSYTGFTSPEPTEITMMELPMMQEVSYKYTRNKYHVTWDYGTNHTDWTEVYSGNVYYGAPLRDPKLTDNGMKMKWDTPVPETMPAQDLVFTGTWEAMQVKVKIGANGGKTENGELPEYVYATYGEPYPYDELPVLTKKGYTFEGWKVNGKKLTPETICQQYTTHSISANFKVINYSITYMNMEGAYGPPKDDTYNVVTNYVELDDARKSGYKFLGWFEDEALTIPVGSPAIPIGSTGDRVFYAKWAPNTYTVIFHANNGTDASVSQTHEWDKKLKLTANTFTNEPWYDFVGWATEPNGQVVYTDNQEVKDITENTEVHLHAVWSPRTFSISYKNLNGVENAPSNPTSFSAGSELVFSDPAAKTGYTFGGWYLDPELTKPADGATILTGAYDWILYAKWTPNAYSITFDSCLGKEVPVETQLFVYDEPQNLTLLSEFTRFQNPGYTFQGWATTKGGEVVYEDGALIDNLLTGGNLDLYAVWTLNGYQITYDLGTGGISHKNPSAYSYEDGQIILSKPEAKEGYQFLGWYTESGTLVSEIDKGEQQDYHLIAKWAHGGIFNLSCTSNYGKLTCTVTRTLPEGTVSTDAPQTIYYRTINGSAFGGTVSYIGEENDYFHFKHVGGPNVYLTFAGGDMEKTFTVELWGGETMADPIAAFVTENTEREFFVELYKIEDTTGTCQGVLGDHIKEAVSLNSGYKMYMIVGRGVDKLLTPQANKDVTVTDSGYNKNTSYTFAPNETGDDLFAKYHHLTATGYRLNVSLDLTEIDDGYQMIAFCKGEKYDAKKLLAEYIFATLHGDKAERTYYLSLPRASTENVDTDISFTAGKCSVTNNWEMYTDERWKTTYGIIDADDTITISFDAMGDWGDDWKYRNLVMEAVALDEKAPEEDYVAPMSFGVYKPGEIINVTVAFDEVIASAENVTLEEIEGLPVGDFTFVGGEGTNALYFECVVKEEFEVTVDFNNYLYNECTPVVNGTVTDCYGNAAN